MHSSTTKTLIGLTISIILSAAAFAQEEQTMKTIKAVDASTGYVTEVARGATKSDVPLIEVPQAITVITADQIKDQNASNLQEALRYAPGVRAEVYGVDNRGDWFSLRGGSEGSTLLDGLRLPLTGFYGVVRVEPFAFESIEVLRGPSSVIAGQNGPGGTVNLVSKRPQSVASREVSVQVGNYSRRQLAADFTGPLNESGTFLYRLVGLASEGDTQIKYADEERQYIAPSLTWRPTDATSLTLFGEYQKDRSMNTNAFLPWVGTILPAPNGPVPTDLFIGEPDWDTYGGTRIRVGFSFEQALGDQWKLRGQVRHDDVEGTMHTMYAAFFNFVDTPRDFEYDVDRNVSRYWYATEDTGKITNGELLLQGDFEFGAIRHQVVVGVDGLHAKMAQYYAQDLATDLDVYTPVYGTFPAPDFNTLYGAPVKNEQTLIGVLLQDQIKIADRYVIVASLRRDSSDSEQIDAPLTRNKESAWTKRLGFVYLANGGIAPYASYSESFEPVANTTFDDPSTLDTESILVSYKPTRGKQIEVGVKYVPENSNVSAGAAAYRLKEANRLSPHPLGDAFPSLQGGEVTVEGLELETSLHFSALDLTANYTYTNGKQTKSSNPLLEATLGKKITSVAKHSASLWAVNNFKIADVTGFRAGLGVRYVGETWDGTDTLATPANTLYDALLSYDANKWGIALNVINIADKDYVAICLTRGDCWFGSRREIAGTVSYKF